VIFIGLIGLHDSEKDHMPKKTFPNFALMKLAAWHKSRGDTVEWWTAMNNPIYERVYSSKVFGFTPENSELPVNITVKGGSGYGVNTKLPPEIDCMKPDYSIYSDCDYALGFITRGCPNNCNWCSVPAREGGIRPYSNWRDIVREDSNKIVLMDNNLLACEYGINQLAELAETDYKIDMNQGFDVSRIDDDIVKIFAKLKWIRYIRFSCDTESKLPYFEKVIELFKKHGISMSRVFSYLLVRKDLAEADRRVQALHEMNRSINIYAQPERNAGIVPNREQKEFAGRYVYGRSYKKETWLQYCKRTNFKIGE
jgi:hypothetical protein